MGKLSIEEIKKKNKERIENASSNEAEEFDIFKDLEFFEELKENFDQVSNDVEISENIKTENSENDVNSSVNDDAIENNGFNTLFSNFPEQESNENEVEEKTEVNEQKELSSIEQLISDQPQMFENPELDRLKGELTDEEILGSNNPISEKLDEPEENKQETEAVENSVIEEEVNEQEQIKDVEFTPSIFEKHEMSIYQIQQREFFDNGNSIVTFAFEGEDIASYFDLGFESTDVDTNFGSITKINTLGKAPYKNLYVIGIGEHRELDFDEIYSLAKTICKEIKEDINVDLITVDFVDKNLFSQVIAELHLGQNYKINKVTNVEQEESKINKIYLSTQVDLQWNLDYGTIIGNSQNLVKDLVYLPSNVLTPDVFVDFIKSSTENLNNVNLDIKNTKQLAEENYGLIVNVNKGSELNAFLVTLEYNGDQSTDVFKTVVGKGITFDTGGYSLKTQDHMLEMHGDMAGAATALSAFLAIARLQPQTNLRCVLPITENLVNGKAFKVEDVLVSKSGKTVQILSTDAEGRLVLADSVTHAQLFKTDEIITVATLTSSNLLTDYEIVPVFANDNNLAFSLVNDANSVNDFIWPMPLNHYNNVLGKKVKNSSQIADIANRNSKAGAPIIYGANFVYNFVENHDISFAHFDIGGQSMVNNKVETPILRTLIKHYL